MYRLFLTAISVIVSFCSLESCVSQLLRAQDDASVELSVIGVGISHDEAFARDLAQADAYSQLSKNLNLSQVTISNAVITDSKKVYDHSTHKYRFEITLTYKQ